MGDASLGMKHAINRCDSDETGAQGGTRNRPHRGTKREGEDSVFQDEKPATIFLLLIITVDALLT